MEQTEKWSIGLISTSKDLDTERCIIMDDLKKWGFQVVAFEGGNFVVDAEKEKNGACISAFDNIDIAIILVGDELGYSSEEMISITCKEYEHVVNLKKYRIIFARKTTWDNYQNTERRQFIRSTPFLDYINNKKKDFINFFYDISHLRELIKEKLEGLSMLLLKSIAESQYTKLMSSITIPSIGNAIKEQLKFYLPSEINPSVNAFGEVIDSSQIYISLIESNKVNHIVVCGEIGSGKSMLLYKNYDAHFNDYHTGSIDRVPLFLSLRGKEKNYSINDYFSECFMIHLKMPMYPLFTYSSNSFVIYADGMDEMSNIIVRNDISSWLSTEFNVKYLMISCRTDFYNNFVKESNFTIDFNFTINYWNAEKTKEYIASFLKDKTMIQNYAIKWIDNNLSNWINTPLLISIICFLLKEVSNFGEAEETLNSIMNEVTLLKKYTSLFIKRELKRIQQDSTKDVDNIYNELMKTAWIFYTQKKNGSMHTLISRNYTTFQYNITKEYLGITELNEYYTYTIHEYFIDFLVSMYTLNQLKENTNSEHFDYMLSADINKLIFQEIDGFPDDKKQSIFNRLFMEYSIALYQNCENIKRRTHIVYYLSRINSNTNKKQLTDILFKIEKEPEIRLSLCFGMIKLGDLEIEEYLYQQIETDEVWNRTNRGYHLLYYKDVEGKEIPYLDENTSDWSKTFFALKNHICNRRQYYYLARIDLQIIKMFIVSHKKHYFTKCDLEYFETWITDIWNKKDLFCKKVISEWNRVKEILKDMSPEFF